MSDHPTPRELRRFVSGDLAGKRLLQVLHHLGRCAECGRRVEPDLAFDPESVDDSQPVEVSPEYDRAVDRAIARALRRSSMVGRERQAAAPVLAAIREGRKVFPRLSERDARRLGGLPMVELLLELSRSHRHSDPGRMIRMADLALMALARLEPGKYGWSFLADVRARAWAELANGYRVWDDLFKAEAYLENAVSWSQQGTGDPLVVARLGDLSASLWSDQRRFPVAIEALAGVHQIYLNLGEPHLAGRALIKKGIFTGYNDQPELAILVLAEGLPLIDEEREPGLTLSALHAMVNFLIDSGNYRKARIVLFKTRHLYHEDGHHLNLVRLSWLEGKINAGLNEFDRAEAALRKARSGFEEVGQTYDAALTALDLAMLWARQGRRAELKALTTELVATFRRHGIAREAIAALLLAHEECDQGWIGNEDLHQRLRSISRLVLELRYRWRGGGRR